MSTFLYFESSDCVILSTIRKIQIFEVKMFVLLYLFIYYLKKLSYSYNIDLSFFLVSFFFFFWEAMHYIWAKLPADWSTTMYRVSRKKLNKTFSCNSGYLAVIIRILFNPHNILWVWHRREKFVIVYFKMTPQRDNRVKGSAVLRAGHKLSEVTNPVGLAQPCTRSSSAWTMSKVSSTDVQEFMEDEG